MTDIIITLPATVEWTDYERELKKVADGREVVNFKVPFFPKNTRPGERCWMVWRGHIRGWMQIADFREDEFYCTTTHRFWKGKFIVRSGKFHYIDPIPRRGFQGWRYHFELGEQE